MAETPPPPNSQAENAAPMDAVNLERALIDFEIANARVIDLTTRLTALSTELLGARNEVGIAKLRISQLEAVEAELAGIKGSRAFRGLRLIGDAKARLLRR